MNRSALFMLGKEKVASQHAPLSLRRSCTLTGVASGKVGALMLAPFAVIVILAVVASPATRWTLNRPSGVRSLSL